MRAFFLTVLVGLIACTSPAWGSLIIDTGSPDGLMAAASRPGSAAAAEIEAADDFILSAPTTITGGTFTGLLPSRALLSSVTDITVEIYRVFPNDSTLPPDGNVVTRVNSPSDVAFDSRDSAALGQLTFTATVLASSFTASNSVLNGINLFPNQNTGGEGPVTGEEVQFTFTLPGGLNLPADHYFFVPQVHLANGDFFWLSAPRPISGGTGPFSPDLQAWIRNAALDPDWSRIGTDIVGGNPAPTFNMSFSLDGVTTPEPSAFLLAATGLGLAMFCRRRRAS
jgi:hypothetical protein